MRRDARRSCRQPGLALQLRGHLGLEALQVANDLARLLGLLAVECARAPVGTSRTGSSAAVRCSSSAPRRHRRSAAAGSTPGPGRTRHGRAWGRARARAETPARPRAKPLGRLEQVGQVEPVAGAALRVRGHQRARVGQRLVAAARLRTHMRATGQRIGVVGPASQHLVEELLGARRADRAPAHAMRRHLRPPVAARPLPLTCSASTPICRQRSIFATVTTNQATGQQQEGHERHVAIEHHARAEQPRDADERLGQDLQQRGRRSWSRAWRRPADQAAIARAAPSARSRQSVSVQIRATARQRCSQGADGSRVASGNLQASDRLPCDRANPAPGKPETPCDSGPTATPNAHRACENAGLHCTRDLPWTSNASTPSAPCWPTSTARTAALRGYL